MEEKHKDILRQNAVRLTIDLEVSHVFLAHLKQDRIITDSNIANLMLPTKTNQERSDEFQRMIVMKGPRAWPSFIRALVETCQNDLAEALDPTLTSAPESLGQESNRPVSNHSPPPTERPNSTNTPTAMPSTSQETPREKETATAKLELLSLTSSTLHEERRVTLLDWAWSLCVAHGRLYTCEEESGLGVYSLDLENLGYLLDGGKSDWCIFGAAEAGEDSLAVASVTGLFVVSKTGAVLQHLSKAWHEDVCGYHAVCLGSDGRLYALCWSSSTDSDSRMAGGSKRRRQVHVYQRQQGSWVKVQQFNTPCTEYHTSIAHTNSIIYISCHCHNILKRKFGQQTEEGWQEIDAVKDLRYPFIAAIDEIGRVLIVDRFGRLLVLSDDSRITELHTEPGLESPVSAVIAGSKLYVACCRDNTLRCFKLE